MKQIMGLLVLSFLFFSAAAQQGNRSGKGKGQGNWSAPQKIMSGKVIDEATGEGLEFATISVFSKKDSSIVGGGLSGPGGTFSFPVKGFRLYAVVEFISYEAVTIDPIKGEKGVPTIELGDILIAPATIELADVEIVAERSETTFSLDKKIFTVGKDLANKGGSAEDVLNNVPSVDVDIEGAVSLRGSEGVRILIDGKPSNLVGSGGGGLRNIPSNLIESVEVITNPSARYEAEGMAGIINIVLKKNQGHGFNGAIDLSGGFPENVGLAANLNYRKGPLNWFLNYGVGHRRGPGGGHTIQDQSISNNTGEAYRQMTLLGVDRSRGGFTNSFRFGTDYFISEKDQITAAAVFRISDNDNSSDLDYQDYSSLYAPLDLEPLWLDTDRSQFFDFDSFESLLNEEAYLSRSIRTDNEIEKESKQEYNLTYTKELSSREHSLNANIQFQKSTETEDNLFVENFQNFKTTDSNSIQQAAYNEENQQTLQGQLDYVHPLGKDHKWETGFRGSSRDINTDYLVTENEVALPGFQNKFDYDEDIVAAYFIYGNRINNLSYQLGTRGEFSFINTQLLESEAPANERKYFNLFPSGHLSFHMNETDAVQLSYSRRIRRPRFWTLNPFYTFSDNRNYFSGNPNLDPEYTDAYELSQIKYWGDFSLNTSIYYRRTSRETSRILVSNQASGTTLRIPLNIGQTDDIGIDLSASYSLGKILRLSLNTNVFNNKLTLDDNEVNDQLYNFYRSVQGYTNSQEELNSEINYAVNSTNNITWNSKLTTKVTFWKSDLQLRANYRGPRQRAQGRSQGIATLDLGWSKDFLAKKNLTLTFSVRDVFNSRKRLGMMFLDEFFQQSESQWRSRVGTLTASYRINQKKKRGGGQRGGSGGGDGGEF